MTEHIGSLASLVGSLTVVGSALLWIYNKFIGTPRETRRQQEEEKRQSRMLEVVKRESEPLNESIRQLTQWLNESKLDREYLNKATDQHSAFIEEHEERLDDHNVRLSVLENIKHIDKKYQFQGGE